MGSGEKILIPEPLFPTPRWFYDFRTLATSEGTLQRRVRMRTGAALRFSG
jgi:hypothetical protein